MRAARAFEHHRLGVGGIEAAVEEAIEGAQAGGGAGAGGGGEIVLAAAAGQPGDNIVTRQALQVGHVRLAAKMLDQEADEIADVALIGLDRLGRRAALGLQPDREFLQGFAGGMGAHGGHHGSGAIKGGLGGTNARRSR